MPTAMLEVLANGGFCHVAARTSRGPHLTPLVFVYSDERLWLTTSRGSVKSRAWRADARVAGLVRDGERAVSFAGRVTAYDALDPGTWQRGIARSSALARASVRFTQKNARFFAGYAIDARHVPLSWTPPGRVFVEIEIERAVLVRGGRVRGRYGPRRDEAIASKRSFRRSSARRDAFGLLPADLSGDLGFERDGVLAFDDGFDVVVSAVGWLDDDGVIAVAVPREVLEAMGGTGDSGRGALVVERPSWWRAKRMTGAMLQGEAVVYDPAQVGSGSRSVGERIQRAGGHAETSALVRFAPDRVVWWRGWESGSRVVVA
jgi:Pyridoxamine 5'-phosphate oxidase